MGQRSQERGQSYGEKPLEGMGQVGDRSDSQFRYSFGQLGEEWRSCGAAGSGSHPGVLHGTVSKQHSLAREAWQSSRLPGLGSSSC